MTRLAFSSFYVVVFSFFAATSFAVTIDYQLTHLGGNFYQYTYSVTNDGSLGASTTLQLFDIAFDVTLYDELTLEILSPSVISDNWLEEIFYSGLDGLAYYNVLALSGGIPVGDTVSGFIVKFNWLGDAAGPGAQDYEIFDAQTFDWLGTDTTRASNTPTTVPEPGALLLLSGGFLGLLGWRHRVARWFFAK